MNSFLVVRRIVVAALVLAVLGAFGAGSAYAQSLRSVNAQLAAIQPQIQPALNDQGLARSVVHKLDVLESQFAQVANNPKANRGDLMLTYQQLQSMLSTMYDGYKKKKDDCIAQIDNGGAQCDYSTPEQVALMAAYPLSWLQFQGAVLVGPDNPARAKQLLNQAIKGFTESTLVIVNPNLIRENLLGRAYCERELGKYDHSAYQTALNDFQQILKDGPETRQYKAAVQGMSTTYAAMGDISEAQKWSEKLSMLGGGSKEQKLGITMFSLDNLLKAEQAASNPAKKAAYHKQAIAFMKEHGQTKQGFAVIISAVEKNVRNPVREFGNSGDPFELWLLANVLYAKHDQVGAAKYYEAAARSGKYPQGYKYAAEIYYRNRRFDQVENLVDAIAAQPGNPDAQWAAYMKFDLPYYKWGQSGRKNAQLEKQWTDAAQGYLKRYPRGEYAYKPRFALAQRLFGQKQYAQASQMFQLVSGNPEYQYEARFSAAEAEYLQLQAASKKKAKNAPEANRDQLRKSTMALLQQTVDSAPAVERSGNKARVQELRGEAIYMLVALMQEEPKKNYPQIASLLKDYETQYPTMKAHFQDIFEWRLQALNKLGRYDLIEANLKSYIERNENNSRANDFIKELGLDFWRDRANKLSEKNLNGAAADAKLTATAYDHFEKLASAGKIPVADLTGTLSILGQAYIAMGNVPRAEQIFSQVVKADPGSPDANAGLARIAFAKKDYKDSINLWSRVQSTAAQSDNLWYESQYYQALIYSMQGNTDAACNMLAATRAQHPDLGTPVIRKEWDTLQKSKCLDRH